jgi:hypothetical protein
VSAASRNNRAQSNPKDEKSSGTMLEGGKPHEFGHNHPKPVYHPAVEFEAFRSA